MEFTTVKLDSRFKHRYKFKAGLYNIREKEFKDVVVFLDTGCYNTVIPRYLAVQSGQSLRFTHDFNLAGGVIRTEAFLIEKMVIGGVVLERIVAFAADLKRNLEGNILLGTNVMNNWDMLISKTSHQFIFRENPSGDLPNRAHIYQNFFDEEGKYVYVQDAG